MSYPTVTLEGVSLTRAQMALPGIQPVGQRVLDTYSTRESASEGPRRVIVPSRFHESNYDIEFTCTLITDADYETLKTAFEAAQTSVSLVAGATTYTCQWAKDGFQPTPIPISSDGDNTLRRVKIKLHVLASA